MNTQPLHLAKIVYMTNASDPVSGLRGAKLTRWRYVATISDGSRYHIVVSRHGKANETSHACTVRVGAEATSDDEKQAYEGDELRTCAQALGKGIEILFEMLGLAD